LKKKGLFKKQQKFSAKGSMPHHAASRH